MALPGSGRSGSFGLTAGATTWGSGVPDRDVSRKTEEVVQVVNKLFVLLRRSILHNGRQFMSGPPAVYMQELAYLHPEL